MRGYMPSLQEAYSVLEMLKGDYLFSILSQFETLNLGMDS